MRCVDLAGCTPVGYCAGDTPDVLSAWLAGNVGVCGSLADGYPDPKTLGGKPTLVAVFGRDAAEVSSSGWAHGARDDRLVV